MGEERRSSDSRKMKSDLQDYEVIKCSDATPSRESDDSTEAVGSVDGSLLTPRTSEAPSTAEEKSESPGYSGGKSYSEEKGAFAKWDSPAKTQGSPMTTGSPEEPMEEKSPDKYELRPATVASRGKKDGSKKALFKNIFGIFKSSKQVKSEKTRLLDPDSSSTTSEEELGGKQPQPHTRDRPLLYTDLTGQVGGHLPGTLDVEEDYLDENITETTSVSMGSKKCIPPSRVVSPEGSTGDASSLERDFEELSSPSKNDQKGRKRTKIQNESSDSEDEAAMVTCASPRKISELQEADHAEGESKDCEMSDK